MLLSCRIFIVIKFISILNRSTVVKELVLTMPGVLFFNSVCSIYSDKCSENMSYLWYVKNNFIHCWWGDPYYYRTFTSEAVLRFCRPVESEGKNGIKMHPGEEIYGN